MSIKSSCSLAQKALSPSGNLSINSNKYLSRASLCELKSSLANSFSARKRSVFSFAGQTRKAIRQIVATSKPANTSGCSKRPGLSYASSSSLRRFFFFFCPSAFSASARFVLSCNGLKPETTCSATPIPSVARRCASRSAIAVAAALKGRFSGSLFSNCSTIALSHTGQSNTIEATGAIYAPLIACFTSAGVSPTKGGWPVIAW